MIKKRIILILLAMVMLVTAVPFVTSAENIFGGFKNLFHYRVEDRTLIITSSDGDYIPEKDLPWFIDDWYSQIEVVVIEEGIISIDDFAFWGFKNLKRVILPSSLNVLGDNAFGSCPILEEVRFDNGFSLSNVGTDVFTSKPQNSIRFYVPTDNDVSTLKDLLGADSSNHTFHLSKAKITGYYATIDSSLRMNFLVQLQNGTTLEGLDLKVEFYREDELDQNNQYKYKLIQTVNTSGFVPYNSDTWTVTLDHNPPQYMGTNIIIKITDRDNNLLYTGSFSFLRYCNTVYKSLDSLEFPQTKDTALKSLLSATLRFGEAARQATNNSDTTTKATWIEEIPNWAKSEDDIDISINNKKYSPKSNGNATGFQCVELMVDADSYIKFTIEYPSTRSITEIKVYRLPQDSEIAAQILNKITENDETSSLLKKPLGKTYDNFHTFSYASFNDTAITLMTNPVSPVDFDTMFYIEIIGGSTDNPQLLDWATYSINSFISAKLTELAELAKQESLVPTTESMQQLYKAYYVYGQAALAYANAITN